jgi:HK97 family phage portal protein
MNLLGPFLDFMMAFRNAAVKGGILFLRSASAVPVWKIEAETVRSIAAVYNAIHAYGDTISTLDFSPMTVPAFGDVAAKPEPIIDNPLRPILLRSFNDQETAQAALAYMVECYWLYGNAYAQIRRNGFGDVVDITPLYPPNVTPFIKDESLYYRFREDTETGGDMAVAKSRVPVELPAYKVIHVYQNYDRAKRKGISPIAFARTSLGVAMALDNHALTFFSQGASPKLMLEYPGKLNEKQQNEMIDNFNRGLVGGENANKTGLLHGGMKLHQLTMSGDDAQFLQSRRFAVNEIARWFNLPPSRIGGDRSSGTYANLEQDQQAFVLHSIAPVCHIFEAEFNRKLLADEDREKIALKFDLSKLMAASGVKGGAQEPEPVEPDDDDLVTVGKGKGADDEE